MALRDEGSLAPIHEASKWETISKDVEAGEEPLGVLSRRERRISAALHFLLGLTILGAVLGLAFLASSDGAISSSSSAAPPTAVTPTISLPPTPSLPRPRTSFEAMKAFLPNLPDDWEEIKQIKVLDKQTYGRKSDLSVPKGDVINDGSLLACRMIL